MQMARTPGPDNATWIREPVSEHRMEAHADCWRQLSASRQPNNIIYIDRENDLVIVTRWANGLNSWSARRSPAQARAPRRVALTEGVRDTHAAV
jgi:hypothetical protein